MKGYYLRFNRWAGFTRDRTALWPHFRLGWITLEVLPGVIADRIARVLEQLRRDTKPEDLSKKSPALPACPGLGGNAEGQPTSENDHG